MSNKNVVIMEDIKHRFVWNTIIEVLSHIKMDGIKSDFKYQIQHPVIHEDIQLDIFMYRHIDFLKWNIVQQKLKDQVKNGCYLCEYNFLTHGLSKENKYIDCINCPSKIITTNTGCMGGSFPIIWNVYFSSVASMSNKEFTTILDHCKKIRDTEFKENVLLRSNVEGENNYD